MIKTMYTSIDTMAWVNMEFGNDFDEYCMEQNAKQIQFYEQVHVYINRDVNVYFKIKKGGYEDGTEYKTRMKMEQNTKHAARKTLVRQTSRKEIIHTRHRLIEKGNKTRNVREGDRGYYW